MNKYGVIDIGSNSVRIMITGDKPYKKIKITSLGAGLAVTGRLNMDAVSRTVSAIKDFVSLSEREGVDEVFAFATAAVRRAENGGEFVDTVKRECGIKIDVISGETEAKLGAMGALGNNDGGIIDIGGASTEVTVYKGGAKIYSYSLDLGTVRIFDLCERDKDRINSEIKEKIKEYGDIPKSEFFGIGGTATTVAAAIQQLEPYAPEKVDGFKITIEDAIALRDRILSSSVKEVENMKGVQKERAKVIGGGVALLVAVMQKIGVREITASEKDNLEGYLLYKKGTL